VRLLRSDGIFLLSNPHFPQLVRGLWISLTSRRKVIFGASSGTSEDLAYLRGLIESGKLRSVIDRRFALEQMVEAHRRAESGEKLGDVLITIPDRDLPAT
jgi:NADPH:quinone reductase-like Zn-dependent oxidoreductase